MAFLTIGADDRQGRQKMSGFGKLMTGVMLAASGFYLLNRVEKPIGGQRVYSEWPKKPEVMPRLTRSTTKIPVETMSEVVFQRRR